MMIGLTTTVLALLGGAQDSAAIQWVFPGDFDQARQRAADEEKILLVKGVSFGIDELGARDASRGQW